MTDFRPALRRTSISPFSTPEPPEQCLYEDVQSYAPGEITQLLRRWEEGEPGVVEALAPLVYDPLHSLAQSYLRRERPDHTLQPTAVVNEVFLDLLRLRKLAFNDRAHFFTFAAQLTRRILIDSARKAKSEKRGAAWSRVPLDIELAWLSCDSPDSFDLSGALNELALFDPSKTRAVELHYFLGCTVDETADILEVSKSTVERNLRFSLAWLRQRLRPV